MVSNVKVAALVAAGLGSCSLLVSLLVLPFLCSEIQSVWDELDKDMEIFKLFSDKVWLQLMTLGHRRPSLTPKRILRQQPEPAPNPSFAGSGECAKCVTTHMIPPLRIPSRKPLCKCSGNQKCAQGPSGPTGIPGHDGNNGPEGVPGKDGIPSFDVSEELGPSSCFPCPSGPFGPAGAKGIPGPSGVKGIAGSPGRSGQSSVPGPLGGVGDPGVAGDEGKPGTKGPVGRNALSGKGPPGQKGDPGPTGLTGPHGPSGKTNTVSGSKTGPVGPPGLPGLRGDNGHNGALGRKGVPGKSGDDAKYCPCPIDGRHNVTLLHDSTLLGQDVTLRV